MNIITLEGLRIPRVLKVEVSYYHTFFLFRWFPEITYNNSNS